jgi:hypothetical protein
MACLIEGIYFLEQQQKKCHEQVRITSGHNRADARQMHLTLPVKF